MDFIWIPVAMVIMALGVYAVAWIFGGNGRRRDLVDDTRKQAADVRAEAQAALKGELQIIEDDRRELGIIIAIESDAERLQALADYANRRGRK